MPCLQTASSLSNKTHRSRIRVHSLRHSYASIMVAKTKDIFYVSKQPGHSNISITVDRYTHLLEKDSENRLMDVLSGRTRKGNLCVDAPFHTSTAPVMERGTE